MIRFYDDYSEGAHPEILEFIAAHNSGQQAGYGLDDWSAAAADRIREAFDTDGDVHFVSGATQANLIGLSSMLDSFQGVIAPTSGHIVVHEAGSVEATGHKVVTVDATDDGGRLTPALIDAALATHEDEHTVMPAAVFMTQATELGTVYRKHEFDEVVGYAKERGLYVFVDGARLAMALGSEQAAMSAKDIARAGVDMFSVGGTKVGAMFGEAIVIPNPDLRRNFRYRMKQRGALMAKGRFLGLQFARFFDDDSLWMQLGKASVDNALYLAQRVVSAGAQLSAPCETNQVFAVLRNGVIEKLQQRYGFYKWSAFDAESSVVRLVCSWATSREAIDTFTEDLAALLPET